MVTVPGTVWWTQLAPCGKCVPSEGPANTELGISLITGELVRDEA